MNILLSNDDGIDASGIWALARALQKRHTVFVVAPDRQRSSISRAVSIGAALHAKRRTAEAFPGILAYAVDGTPADCVRAGLGALTPVRIDLCMTGVNYGYNVGTDTLYSGTAGAAIEAAVSGVPAVALSNGMENGGKYMDTAGAVAAAMADFCLRHPLPHGAFYNVNVPDLPLAALKGAGLAKLSWVPYDLTYETSSDADGGLTLFAPWTRADETDADTDRALVSRGFVSVTALAFDNACNDSVGSVSEKEWKELGGRICG